MGIAALITWIITAGGGFFLLSVWLRRGGMRQQADGTTSFRAPLIFGHFLLAALGLVLWLVYVVTDAEGLKWPTFGVIIVVALLGFTMFSRWMRVRGGAPAKASAGAGGNTGSRSFTGAGGHGRGPGDAERSPVSRPVRRPVLWR